SVLVAVIVGVISLYARPWAYRQSYQIEADARAEFDIRKIEPGRFIELQGSEYVLFARAVDQGKGRLEEVFLQSDRGEKIQVTYAREAWLPPVQPGTRRSFKFRNGYSYLLDRRGSRDTTLKFKTLLIPIPEQKRDTSYRRKAEATPTLRASSTPKDIAEYQWRVSTPFATLMLALLAVPLSRSAPRRGRHYNFILAILAYVAVFVLVSAFRTWVEDAKIPASPGLWWAYLLPMLLFVALTVFPVWQRRKR
ncbi:MAG TPA: LptF/LptG family permease, partial [Gammaproteobacteria bacterium]|nr:LptF/LptG family permease [Gammaproteobacteria bacterium]